MERRPCSDRRPDSEGRGRPCTSRHVVARRVASSTITLMRRHADRSPKVRAAGAREVGLDERGAPRQVVVDPGAVTRALVADALAVALDRDRREVQHLIERARRVLAQLDLPAAQAREVERRITAAERAPVASMSGAVQTRDTLRELVQTLERAQDAGTPVGGPVPVSRLPAGMRRVVGALDKAKPGWVSAPEVERAYRGATGAASSKAKTIIGDLRNRYGYDVVSPTLAARRGLEVPTGVKNAYRMV